MNKIMNIVKIGKIVELVKIVKKGENSQVLKRVKMRKL